jgi:hypothetical protein
MAAPIPLQMLTIRPPSKAVLQPNWAAAGAVPNAVSEAKAAAAKMIFFMTFLHC